MKYLSRSQLQTWRDCSRKGFLQYGFKGRGVTANSSKLELMVGSAIHAGVTAIMLYNNEGAGVEVALDYFNRKAQNQIIADTAEEYVDITLAEQEWLTEALVRVWARKEWPNIQRFYNVKLVEKELQVTLDEKLDLHFLSTPDAVLEDKTNKQLFVYSLKTLSQYDMRADRSHTNDLQGITESVALEHKIGKLVAGVRYCFLIKGSRWKVKHPVTGEYTGRRIQETPLCKAWKRVGADGVRYAHSWRVPNEYDSGYTTLGKGWNSCNMWEEPISCAEWVRLLTQQLIPPISVNVVNNSCLVPTERFRYPRECQETMTELTADAKRIQKITELVNIAPAKIHTLTSMNHRACWYPSTCEYADIICHKRGAGTVWDAIEAGLENGALVWRNSHHKREQQWITKNSQSSD